MSIKAIYNFDDDDLFFPITPWGDSRHMSFHLRATGPNVLVRHPSEITSEQQLNLLISKTAAEFWSNVSLLQFPKYLGIQDADIDKEPQQLVAPIAILVAQSILVLLLIIQVDISHVLVIKGH